MKLSLSVFLLLTFAISAWAEEQWLITPEEAKREAGWEAESPLPKNIRTRVYIGRNGPDISLITPTSTADPLISPFPIHIAFKAKEGATIKPESFMALYGFKKFDITERLTRRAKIEPEGITIENAAIPAGSHRLILRIIDDRGGQSIIEIRFAVQ